MRCARHYLRIRPIIRRATHLAKFSIAVVPGNSSMLEQGLTALMWIRVPLTCRLQQRQIDIVGSHESTWNGYHNGNDLLGNILVRVRALNAIANKSSREIQSLRALVTNGSDPPPIKDAGLDLFWFINLNPYFLG